MQIDYDSSYTSLDNESSRSSTIVLWRLVSHVAYQELFSTRVPCRNRDLEEVKGRNSHNEEHGLDIGERNGLQLILIEKNLVQRFEEMIAYGN